jgi:hypothetical protein
MRGLAVVAVAGVVGENKSAFSVFCFYFYYPFLFLFFIGLLDFRKIAKSVSALLKYQRLEWVRADWGVRLIVKFPPTKTESQIPATLWILQP